MTVEPVRGMEGEERCHANDNRPEHLVPDIEVVMGEAAGLMRQDAVVGILRGILRHADPKRPALLHALEDEVHAVSLPLLHAPQCRQNVIPFAHPSPRPLDRDLVVAGEGFYPALAIVGAMAENFLAHHRRTDGLPNQLNNLLRPGQPSKGAVTANAVKASVY